MRIQPRVSILAIVALAAVAVLALPAAAQSFSGLGDLAGGQVYSEAWGVSADGATVVGATIIEGNVLFGGTYAAFRWTAAGGMEDIHELGGIGTVCRAYAANSDGSVIVGAADYGVLAGASVAFIWNEESGAVEIGDLPGGADRGAARGVSADGTILAG